MSPADNTLDITQMPDSPTYELGKVCICLPWYRTADPRTTFSLLALLDRRKHMIALDFGDAFVAHSRNKLTENFLKTSAEWMFSLDADMIPPFGNASLYRSFTGFSHVSDKFAGMNAIERLISHGRTLVGGLYFGRWSHGKPTYSEGAESKQEEEFCRRGPTDLCKPCRWVGSGAIMIHRSVFLDIEKKFPSLARTPNGKGGNWWTSSEHDLRNSVDDALFKIDEGASIEDVKEILRAGKNRSARNSSLGVGEDVILAQRAAQAGHPCHVDLGLLCGHVGEYSYGPKKIIT